MIPAGLIVGLGGGPLWCAKCTYLSVVSYFSGYLLYLFRIGPFTSDFCVTCCGVDSRTEILYFWFVNICCETECFVHSVCTQHALIWNQIHNIYLSPKVKVIWSPCIVSENSQQSMPFLSIIFKKNNDSISLKISRYLKPTASYPTYQPRPCWFGSLACSSWSSKWTKFGAISSLHLVSKVSFISLILMFILLLTSSPSR